MGLEDLTGFNLLYDHQVFCHYTSKDASIIQRLTERSERIIALEEDSAIYLDDKSAKAIGNGVHLYTGDKEISFSDGQALNLNC